MANFAVKLQIVAGKPDDNTNHDYRGSEPNDQHRTIKNPITNKGLEIDPIDDTQLPFWLERVKILNETLADMFPPNDFGHIEARIMDSDNRV